MKKFDWKPYVMLLITTIGGVISGIDMIQRDRKMEELDMKLDILNKHYAEEKSHEQN